MKRFTETHKWLDPWFHRLSAGNKLLWHYLCDNCDSAGVIDIDLEIAAFHIGVPQDKLDLSKFGDRIEKLPCGKYWLPKFVKFQYGTLSDECRPHKVVLDSLEKHGLKDRVSIGYQYPTNRAQDKDQVQDKDKTAGAEEKKDKRRGTIDEVYSFFAEIGLSREDAESFFYANEANGWTINGKPIKDWKSKARSWKSSGFHPSQKNGGTPRGSGAPGTAGNPYL